ncbi:MAG: xylulokinase [Anaerolineae bacterium]|nr:xylulokinase [Anaerolineae bacterium]
MSVILAHDLGTTGNKATLFDTQTSTTIDSTFQAYDTAYPYPNWAEQDPADWQRALIGCTHRLLDETNLAPSRIAAVSFSGHMQGALIVDREGAPLRTAIIWADQRATEQTARIAQTCGKVEVYRRTGCQVSPSYTAAKLMWIRDCQPDLYRRAFKVLQPKDYAVYLLTGVWATDYSDASGTQLFDLAARHWATDLIAALDLDPGLFPDAHPSTQVIGTVTPQAAVQTGLRAGTPVVIGGGDGACATVGAGAVQPGDAYNYIGSSAWIAVTTKRPLIDPQQRTFTFCHLDPALYFSVGTTQAAGGSYGWLERLFHTGDSEPDYQELDTLAAQNLPGAGGLIFLPHLLGERSPYWNPLARGAFVGLTMPHERGALARAVLEGVAFNMCLTLDTLRENGVEIAQMRLIGGGARSALWRQILADVYGLPILLPHLTAEATALGAALAGGVGVGIYPDFSVAKQIIPARLAEQPIAAHHSCYQVLYGLYQDAYRALEPIFARLSTLDQAQVSEQ